MLTGLKPEGSSGKALRQCIAGTRRCGTVGVPGIYDGFIHGFPFGDASDKGLSFKMGQTHVQALMPEFLEAIGEGELDPEIIISPLMKLTDAVRAYDIFVQSLEECRKVLLTP